MFPAVVEEGDEGAVGGREAWREKEGFSKVTTVVRWPRGCRGGGNFCVGFAMGAVAERVRYLRNGCATRQSTRQRRTAPTCLGTEYLQFVWDYCSGG